MSGDPIRPGSPLTRVLDDYPVPPLSAGFADRVIAAAEKRAPALPSLRRESAGRGWRTGRRFAIALMSFGALATAAAATGVLERVGLPVPSAETVWANLTGGETPATAAPAVSKPAVAAVTAPLVAPVVIEGPIDTPEELSEAFRRIDEVRQGRSAVRRQIIDRRLDGAIKRREAAGLPVPDAEQQARLRQRIDDIQTEREALAGQRIEARREELRQRVESGEALTRENLLPNRQSDEGTLPDRRLRDMSPQERRAFIRNLPLEQRRMLTEDLRRFRDQKQSPTPEPAPAVPDAAPETAVPPR